MFHLIRLTMFVSIMCAFCTNIFAYDIGNGVTVELRSVTKTFSQQSVKLWVYCLSGVAAGTPGECAAPTYPGPLLELGVGQSTSVSLSIASSLTPNEDGAAGSIAGFSGHTIHFANLDLATIDDGVASPYPAQPGTLPNNTAGYSYAVDLGSTNPGHVGGHAYYCHVHQTKHLEMGEFGALIIRPVDAAGAFLKTINTGGPSYDVEANFILSTIDPIYHLDTSVGESSLFASYNPTLFLINGAEGLASTTPALTIDTLVNQTVAIRLIGMQGVNVTFQVVDSLVANALGTAQSFVLHNIDGWAQTPKTVSRVELSPGQTKDILIRMPATTSTWYPVVTFKHLRDDATLANVISVINVQ